MREGKSRHVRVAAQWLIVGLAHAATLDAVLHASPPQPPRAMPIVIHASLITAQPQPGLTEIAPPRQEERPPPPKKPPRAKPPKKNRTPPQKAPKRAPKIPPPLFAAAPASEKPPAPPLETKPSAAGTESAQPQTEASPTESGASATGLATASATDAATASAGNSSGDAITPPIFSAAYLENPPPPYPPLSRRRGETGRVVLRVHVTPTGRAARIEIDASSGFERLDEAAQAAVYGWRFVPAQRGAEPVAAWVRVPVLFVL